MNLGVRSFFMPGRIGQFLVTQNLYSLPRNELNMADGFSLFSCVPDG